MKTKNEKQRQLKEIPTKDLKGIGAAKDLQFVRWPSGFGRFSDPRPSGTSSEVT